MDGTNTAVATPSRAFQAALTAIFLVGIAAPPLATALRSGDAAAAARQENRRAAPFPDAPGSAADLSAFPTRFDEWYRDGFGLRTALVTWNSLIKVFGLGVSPTPSLLVGKDRWIFDVSFGAIDGVRGVDVLDGREMNEWREGLEARKRFLDARGIRFLYVLVPHKANVYPDRMADRLEPVGPSRLGRFLEHMRQNSDVDIVDLRPAFTRARADDTNDRHLYSPHGVHWSESGAWVAADVILDALGDIALADGRWRSEDVRVSGGVDPSDSWARKLYLADHLIQRRSRLALARKPLSRRLERADSGFPRDSTFVREDGRGARCVVVHDSFGTELLPFLAESFSRLDGWRDLDFVSTRIVDAEPDVVIQVYSELTLVSQRPNRDANLAADAILEEYRGANVRLLSVREAAALSPHPLSRGAVLRDVAGGIEIEVKAANALLVLPDLPPRTGAEDRLLGIQIVAPERRQLAIFYQLPGMTEIDRRSAFLVTIEAGFNEVAVRLPDEELAGPLVLGLGRTEGPYLVRSLEVRAVPR